MSAQIRWVRTSSAANVRVAEVLESGQAWTGERLELLAVGTSHSKVKRLILLNLL